MIIILMILKILGFLDVITSIALFLGSQNTLFMTIGVIIFIKGVYSIVSSVASGYYFDIMGVIDLISGICLLSGFGIPFLWLVMLAKGAYSMI